MPKKDTSLINRLKKKNEVDTLVLGIACAVITAIIIYFEDKTQIICYEIIVLFVYYVFYQVSRSDLMLSMDKLIDNELKEFQKSSEKILQLSEKQRQITNNYIERLESLIQTAKMFKSNIMLAKDKTQILSTKMQNTHDFSKNDMDSLNENIAALQNLKQKVQVIAELIIELTDYVKQIGSTVSIVENISEQTNMLALNAAVEAARAGEYGKGFAVVASEIRKLADESKQATNKISTLVTEIEQTTSSTIVATEDGAREIEIDVKNAGEINKNFANLVNEIKDLSFGINEILITSRKQQTVADEVLEAIDNMKNGMSDSIKNVEENIENIKVFSKISTNIKDNLAN